ncbi:MAG: QueT transporter family protein, partial [Clostridium sp.]
MKSKKLVFICQAAVIAALYVVLTYVFSAFASGVIQVRVSEALTILPAFTPAAIPGLVIGCLLSNTLTGCVLLDIIFGSVATLIGALGSYALRRHTWLVPIPPIVSNMIIVPFVLRYAYGATDAFPFMIATVGAGEIISCYLLGMLLY